MAVCLDNILSMLLPLLCLGLPNPLRALTTAHTAADPGGWAVRADKASLFSSLLGAAPTPQLPATQEAPAAAPMQEAGLAHLAPDDAGMNIGTFISQPLPATQGVPAAAPMQGASFAHLAPANAGMDNFMSEPPPPEIPPTAANALTTWASQLRLYTREPDNHHIYNGPFNNVTGHHPMVTDWGGSRAWTFDDECPEFKDTCDVTIDLKMCPMSPFKVCSSSVRDVCQMVNPSGGCQKACRMMRCKALCMGKLTKEWPNYKKDYIGGKPDTKEVTGLKLKYGASEGDKEVVVYGPGVDGLKNEPFWNFQSLVVRGECFAFTMVKGCKEDDWPDTLLSMSLTLGKAFPFTVYPDEEVTIKTVQHGSWVRAAAYFQDKCGMDTIKTVLKKPLFSRDRQMQLDSRRGFPPWPPGLGYAGGFTPWSVVMVGSQYKAGVAHWERKADAPVPTPATHVDVDDLHVKVKSFFDKVIGQYKFHGDAEYLLVKGVVPDLCSNCPMGAEDPSYNLTLWTYPNRNFAAGTPVTLMTPLAADFDTQYCTYAACWLADVKSSVWLYGDYSFYTPLNAKKTCDGKFVNPLAKYAAQPDNTTILGPTVDKSACDILKSIKIHPPDECCRDLGLMAELQDALKDVGIDDDMGTDRVVEIIEALRFKQEVARERQRNEELQQQEDHALTSNRKAVRVIRSVSADGQAATTAAAVGGVAAAHDYDVDIDALGKPQEVPEWENNDYVLSLLELGSTISNFSNEVPANASASQLFYDPHPERPWKMVFEEPHVAKLLEILEKVFRFSFECAVAIVMRIKEFCLLARDKGTELLMKPISAIVDAVIRGLKVVDSLQEKGVKGGKQVGEMLWKTANKFQLSDTDTLGRMARPDGNPDMPVYPKDDFPPDFVYPGQGHSSMDTYEGNVVLPPKFEDLTKGMTQDAATRVGRMLPWVEDAIKAPVEAIANALVNTTLIGNQSGTGCSPHRHWPESNRSDWPGSGFWPEVDPNQPC